MESSGQVIQMFHPGREGALVCDLWTDGLICAFEFVRGSNRISDSHWVPIGWARISELVKIVEADAKCSSQQINLIEDEDDFTVSGVVAPYWQHPEGHIWWCHVFAGHSSVYAWLSNAHWLHPNISISLRDENRHISECMKYFGFEVPVRVSGGLLFELLGHSVSDSASEEDDTPIVLRCWQSQQFLVTAMHLKSFTSKINIRGTTEVQELLLFGGIETPKSVDEIIAQLTCRLSRLFHKFIFGVANEIELKILNWRTYEDPNQLNIILNQDIKKLAKKIIRVQLSLRAREEIVFELLQHLRGTTRKSLLEEIKNTTSEMLQEQEAVRGRLFTIQDVFQSTVCAYLKDKSQRITRNLEIFGGCGLVLSIVISLFWINLDEIPGAENIPYAFALFCGLLLFIGIILIYFSMLFLGLKKPATEEQVNARKLELQRLIFMFKHDIEAYAKVREGVSRLRSS